MRATSTNKQHMNIKSILPAVLDTREFGATEMLTPTQIASMGHRAGIYGDINGRPVVAHVVRADARGREIAVTLRYVGGGAVPTRTISKILSCTVENVSAAYVRLEQDNTKLHADIADIMRIYAEIDAELTKLKQP